MESCIKFEQDASDFEKPSKIDMSNFCEKVAIGERKMYCCTFPNCLKAFKYKSEMARHSTIHSDYRPFRCTFEGCDKAFKRNDTLETHLLIHSGTMSFACEIPGCKYRSRSRSGLYFHTLKHENVKNYKCKVQGCEKSFLTKTLLKQHEKSSNDHMVMNIAKKEEFDDDTLKMVKKEMSDSDQKTDSCSNFVEMEKSASCLPSAFGSNDQEIGLKGLLQALEKENEILKRALDVHFDLLKQSILTAQKF